MHVRSRPALAAYAAPAFLIFAILVLAASSGSGTEPPAASNPADTNSVTIPLAGATNGPSVLQFTFFSFDGKRLPAAAIRVRDLAPGVHELTNSQNLVGTFECLIQDESDYFGFGERFDALNQAHRIIENASRDTPGAKGGNTYAPIPFFMSTRGYGLWLDTYSDAIFDLNATDLHSIILKFAGNKLRMVVFDGPQFPLILNRFTALVGRAQLPPYWAFAPWKSRDYHVNEGDVYEDIDKYRQLGLPASVLVIDSPWATNYNTFVMNDRQFTHPRQTVQRIHDEGYKLCLWLTPFINVRTHPTEPGIADKIPTGPASNYDEAAARGYFVKTTDGKPYVGPWWKGSGSLIDFTNPAAREWWKGQVHKAVVLGANAFKDDDGEGSFLGQVEFAGGQDPFTMRNRYSVLYNQTMEEVVQNDLHGDGVLFMRSGSVGTQNLPFTWGGDNEANFSPDNGLPTVVTAGLSAGLSGEPLWGADLGGYIKSKRTPGDDKLFIRWTEYAAFSPLMEVHSQMNLGPWDYGAQALAIFRQYSVLHMSLFPYLYAAAQESARDGMPIMRALVLENQDDERARATRDEYYFGPDLLVAPVLSDSTQRAVYLPPGDWLDYWTGAALQGGQTIAADAPLARIPLYVRAGAILPKIPDDVMTLVPPGQYSDKRVKSLDNRRIYEIYPGKVRPVTDFEGRTVEPAPAGHIRISGKPAEVTLRWRFQAPRQVIINGKPVPLVRSKNQTSVHFLHRDTTDIHTEW